MGVDDVGVGVGLGVLAQPLLRERLCGGAHGGVQGAGACGGGVRGRVDGRFGLRRVPGGSRAAGWASDLRRSGGMAAVYGSVKETSSGAGCACLAVAVKSCRMRIVQGTGRCFRAQVRFASGARCS